MKWLLILLGLIYALFPLDLIPDMALPLGLADDAALVLLFWFLIRLIAKPQKQKRPYPGHEPGRDAGRDAGRENTGRQKQGTGRGGQGKQAPQSPHEVLGIAPGATQQEIREAFRKLAAQYHPDKVEHLGPEFREMADQRFKEINAAYNQLKKP